MAALPYIQLYIAEYLADTAHLTTLQHGAYLLLIFNYWQRGKPLSNSSERLASVARMSNEEWKIIEPTLAEFFEVTESEWIHHRIESDLIDVLSKSTKASAAGKASAQKRYGNRTFNERSTDDEPLRTDTDKDKEVDTEQNKKQKKQVVPLPPPQVIEEIGLKLEDYESYMAVRKAKKQAFVDERARDKWIAKWKRYFELGYDTAAMFDLMISSGWIGVVEEKWTKRKREIHVLTQRELDEQNYRDFGSPSPEEWAPIEAPQGWVPCHN